jgi:hypothetical protein
LDIDTQAGTIVTGSSDWGIRRFDLVKYGLTFARGSPSEPVDDMDVDVEKLQIKAPATSRTTPHRVPTTFDGGLEFRAGRGCCAASRSRCEGYNADFEPVSSRASACLHCGKKSHTDLVRALWLGERVVVSGSYDSTIKVRFLHLLTGRQWSADRSFEQIWDRKTGLLITDLSDVHTGRIFCVVGDKTKVVSSGIDQVNLAVASNRTIPR